MSNDSEVKKVHKKSPAVVPIELIEKKIYLIRGHKVMLDSDLAELYGVKTKVLLQSVKRNINRFPSDFTVSYTHLTLPTTPYV